MKKEEGDFQMGAPGYGITRVGDAKTAEEEPQVEPKPGMERLNFNVSPKVAAEIRQLAGELDMSMTQLFKYAMSIVQIAAVEGRKHRKLVIADKNGVALREFVLPGFSRQ